VTGRSGPIVIEIEYRVPRHRARTFYGVMQGVQSCRQRSGAYGWSIARDLSNPELWTERYYCPTWFDYLRQRNRLTQAERELLAHAFEFHAGPGGLHIRRMLERPFGSVRWREDVRDAATPAISLTPPGGVGP
ncbi:MAG: MFS transporter, partial [Alphaproteobacteria bacterium]|nr:MFS transporter [Alphaproteobacteria bacterium]